MYPAHSIGQRLLRLILPTMCACLLVLNMPLTGYAALTPCRGDPIIETTTFRVQSVVEVYTTIANIHRVDYTYHVPRGIALPIMYDSSPLAAKEKAIFVSTNGTGLQIDTLVSLNSGVAPVKVNVITTVTNKLTGMKVTKTVTGMSGQLLVINAGTI